jgi:nucleoside-diphosphate-sugar epimerase
LATDLSSPHISLLGPGFLGEQLAKRILQARHSLSCFTRSLTRAQALIQNQIPTLALDLTAPQSWQPPSLPQDTTLFIHALSTSGGNEEAYRHTYLLTTQRLIHHYPQAKILFISSTSVYGQNTGEAVTETSPAEPASPTSRILRATEDLVLAHHGTVARLSGLYGPHRWALVQKFLNGTATLDADGSRIVNQIHRDDAAQALLTLIDTILHKPDAASTQIYNITDDYPTPLLEFYTHLAQVTQRPLPPYSPPNPLRKRGLTSKRVLNHKIRTLGWRPNFPSFRDALPHVLPTLLAT